MITGALKSLFALSEAYPDLKANQNFLNLQEELTGTEGRIAYARQFYNDTVQKLQHEDPDVPGRRARRHVPLHASASTSRSRTQARGAGAASPSTRRSRPRPAPAQRPRRRPAARRRPAPQ